jgi:transcriptional regulator
VPTWNYQAVHAYGVPHVIESSDKARDHVLALVHQHEAMQPAPWQPELPDDYLEGMLCQIVAFRLDIARIETKFKLSQNRGAADRENVTSSFEASANPTIQALGRAMRASPALPTSSPEES